MKLRERARHGTLSVLSLGTKPQAGPSLRLVYLHSVLKDQVSAFEKQITYLLSIGTFLRSSEVLQVVRGQRALDKRYFHLSFDDGLRNVITNALPVLRALDVTAIFFVPTAGIIDGGDGNVDGERSRLHSSSAPAMATWNDLEKAQNHGLEIGSHTRSHARLSDISASLSRMEDEIEGSKADIEMRLGRTCAYMSWPFGRQKDADRTSLKHVERAGYDACFGAFRGRVEPGKTNPFAIPRHHFEPNWPLSHFKYFVHGARESRE